MSAPPATAGRRLLVVLLGVLAVLAVAGPAAAHVGNGQAGSDFAGRVRSVTPELPGVSARVLSFGDELEVVNRTGTELAVPGYSGEPYLRIGPDGVWRNARSPATYLNLDRYATTGLPPVADVAAEPDWQQVSTQPQYLWHDHRTHWMSRGVLPPVVAADPDRPHTVIEWTVPMTYGGAPVVVAGELTWRPPPPAAVVWPVHLLLLAAVAGTGWLARTPRPLAAVLALVAVAALWHAAATPVPPVTLSSHAGALVGALLPALLLAAVAAVGIRGARRGRGALTGTGALVAGWLALVQGLPDVDVLWSANVLAIGPGGAARVAVALLVVGGIGLVAAGAGALRRFRGPRSEPAAAAGAGPAGPPGG